jgi:hypothetical protein
MPKQIAVVPAEMPNRKCEVCTNQMQHLGDLTDSWRIPAVRVFRCYGCYSAWGPYADRHHKLLIDLPSAGSMLGADSQADVAYWHFSDMARFPN